MRDALAADPTLRAALCDDDPGTLLAPLAADALGERSAEGLDLILEGFLLHHGAARHLSIADPGRRVLAGDYCYATGLVRVAEAGDLFVIAALSDLIALGAGAVADGRRGLLADLWRGTVAAIADRASDPDGAERRFATACAAFEDGRVDRMATLATSAPPTPGLAEALAA